MFFILYSVVHLFTQYMFDTQQNQRTIHKNVVHIDKSIGTIPHNSDKVPVFDRFTLYIDNAHKEKTLKQISIDKTIK